MPSSPHMHLLHVALTGTVIVSTPQEVALADVRKGIIAFQRLSIPVRSLLYLNFFVRTETISKDTWPRPQPVILPLPHLQYTTPSFWFIQCSRGPWHQAPR